MKKGIRNTSMRSSKHVIIYTKSQMLTLYRFRAKLEYELSKAWSVPLILVVAGGGSGTWNTILEAIENNVPSVIITGTKGVADDVVEIFHTEYLHKVKV